MRTEKNKILLVIMMSGCMNINGQDLLDNYKAIFNIWSAGLCINLNTEGTYFIFDCNTLGIRMEHRKLHFGLGYELINIKIFYFENVELDTIEVLYFNPSLYLKLLLDDKIMVGPFISLNYISLDGLINFYKYKVFPSDIIFSVGIKFRWRNKYYTIPNAINMDIGYKNNIGGKINRSIGIDAGLGYWG